MALMTAELEAGPAMRVAWWEDSAVPRGTFTLGKCFCPVPLLALSSSYTLLRAMWELQFYVPSLFLSLPLQCANCFHFISLEVSFAHAVLTPRRILGVIFLIGLVVAMRLFVCDLAKR